MEIEERVKLDALVALCGFWDLLEEVAPMAGCPTGTHLLDALRQGNPKHAPQLFQAYKLAVWVSDVSGIALEDAPLELRQFRAFKKAQETIRRKALDS